ncbi:4-oxalocrotonate tautomerase family protein [Fulvivirga kasyanovii]
MITKKQSEMPYINIRVTDEGVTKKQKQELIAGATKLMVDILGKNPETTHVVIDEVPIDNWGVRGEQYSERVNQKKAQ